MERISKLTDARLDSLYTAEDFGAERTMRARVIRELIDEIRALRLDLASERASGSAPLVERGEGRSGPARESR